MTPDYAFYVWSAYGVAGVAIGLLVLYGVLDHRAEAKALARLEEQGRGPRG